MQQLLGTILSLLECIQEQGLLEVGYISYTKKKKSLVWHLREKESRGWAVSEINRQWKLFDLLPSVLMLQKEAKEGKKDKDSDKEDEDSGKWGDWEDDEATSHWINVEEMVVKYCTMTTPGYVWLQSVQKHVCYLVRKI